MSEGERRESVRVCMCVLLFLFVCGSLFWRMNSIPRQLAKLRLWDRAVPLGSFPVFFHTKSGVSFGSS